MHETPHFSLFASYYQSWQSLLPSLHSSDNVECFGQLAFAVIWGRFISWETTLRSRTITNWSLKLITFSILRYEKNLVAGLGTTWWYLVHISAVQRCFERSKILGGGGGVEKFGPSKIFLDSWDVRADATSVVPYLHQKFCFKVYSYSLSITRKCRRQENTPNGWNPFVHCLLYYPPLSLDLGVQPIWHVAVLVDSCSREAGDTEC